MKYLVITEVPPAGDRGNLAVAAPLYLDPQATGGSWSDPPKPLAEALGLPPMLAMYVQAPVFALGEVLLVDEDGRELAGAGRKPDKWDVRTEWFDDADTAVARARELTDAALAALIEGGEA